MTIRHVPYSVPQAFPGLAVRGGCVPQLALVLATGVFMLGCAGSGAGVVLCAALCCAVPNPYSIVPYCVLRCCVVLGLWGPRPASLFGSAVPTGTPTPTRGPYLPSVHPPHLLAAAAPVSPIVSAPPTFPPLLLLSSKRVASLKVLFVVLIVVCALLFPANTTTPLSHLCPP